MSATKHHYHNEIEAGQRTSIGQISSPGSGEVSAGRRGIKEHPILFSTPMVKAILEGRKTQTRRVVKTNGKGWDAQDLELSLTETITREFAERSIARASMHNALIGFHAFFYDDGFHKGVKCPYGQPGDLLWVRESFKYIDEEETRVDYKSQYTYPEYHKWKPSIHMPKAAARIWLEITEVKVERLRNISEADAKAEGVELLNQYKYNYYKNYYQREKWGGANGFYLASQSFRSLWFSINGRESWIANPWVWVVKFKVISTTGKPSTTPSITSSTSAPQVSPPGQEGSVKACADAGVVEKTKY